MKYMFKALRLTLVFCLVLALGYVLVLWLFAKTVAPSDGNVEVLTVNGKAVGAKMVGQEFDSVTYFWGRPSYAGSGYDATSSGGSNMGPSDSAYVHILNARISGFMAAHPYLTKADVPAEMVTASASGLDPDITPRCAEIQVKRVAMARGVSDSLIIDLLNKHIHTPAVGPRYVNVLQLNVALDSLCDTQSNTMRDYECR